MEKERGKVWVHLASVGEFNTARPILRELYSRHHVVLTYFSFRAKEYLKSQQGKGYFHELYRLPPDVPLLMKFFEKKVEPEAILIFERELWPSLLLFTRAPKVWLNAYAKGRFLESFLSRRFCLIVARREEDAETFRRYSCRKVLTCGNLKFALEEPSPTHLKVEGSKLVVAGSTHPGEEELLLEAFRKLRVEFPDLRLIVAPRHVSRATQVAELFKAFRVSLRSKEEEDWDVLVVDTLGELFSLYAHARVAVVGGTFVPVGGHNLLEPAYFGKPVLYGPYTHKVEDLRSFVESRSMGFCVRDPSELYERLHGLLAEEFLTEFSLKEHSQEVLRCYLRALEEFWSDCVKIV
ncbi:MAG: 3-deoxy-D-manno-octulosonic acid transferase [Aquificaceae bacterium]|nr:3-deoxy-D-manno-octulosonic acid transferase [Aquificaceae bacterium]MCX8060535.1 3-deoxy-D-manno-octulosonic acid transferase [Aquificaceae bacterium]MDW8097192.1 glycosyltransferase N-terminal domain-containing protein [Aquificaceae bacterium]